MAQGLDIAGRRSPPSALTALIDWGERTMLFVLFLLLAERLWPSFGRAPVNSLLLAGESLAVGFIVFRRASEVVSVRPIEWLVALAGTLPSLLFAPGGMRIAPAGLAAGLMLAGLLIQLSGKMFLRRSFGMAAANRGVKRGGAYRFVRHPIYLGYMTTWLGFVLINFEARNVALAIFASMMQVVRISFEERLLGADAAYRAYAGEVRFRLVPGVF
ncbi:MAG: methyltransferase family protein [Caulobacteraceae bacterium]